MSIFNKVTKGEIAALIKDHPDTVCFCFFRKNTEIAIVQTFLDIHLNGKPHNYQLSEDELNKIVGILKARFLKMPRYANDYRLKPQKNANQFYTELAKLISTDPHVLCLVSFYKNDFDLEGNLLMNSMEDFFVSQANYACPAKQIEKELIQDGSFYLRELYEAKYIKRNDLDRLKLISPGLRNIIETIETKYDRYVNQTDMQGVFLNTRQIDPNNVFVSEDNYFCLLDEILYYGYKKDNEIYNPFTSMCFSKSDTEKLKQLPRFMQLIEDKEQRERQDEALRKAHTRVSYNSPSLADYL